MSSEFHVSINITVKVEYVLPPSVWIEAEQLELSNTIKIFYAHM